MTAPAPGSLAARKVTFGDMSRYAVAPVHSRFGGVSWFVWDADVEADGPAIIRQAETLVGALAGLPGPTAREHAAMVRAFRRVGGAR